MFCCFASTHIVHAPLAVTVRLPVFCSLRRSSFEHLLNLIHSCARSEQSIAIWISQRSASSRSTNVERKTSPSDQLFQRPYENLESSLTGKDKKAHDDKIDCIRPAHDMTRLLNDGDN